MNGKENAREGKNRTVVEKPKESNKVCDSDAIQSTDPQTRQRENKRGPQGKTERREQQKEREKRNKTRKETGRKTDDRHRKAKKRATKRAEKQERDTNKTDNKTVCDASMCTTGKNNTAQNKDKS